MSYVDPEDGSQTSHVPLDWYFNPTVIPGYAVAGGSLLATVELDLRGGGTLQGSEGADHLLATAYGTHLVGMGGNDYLHAAVDGGIFDLVFEGGQGIDHLRGSYARDTYRFRLGDGQDLIVDDVRDMGSGVAEYFAAVPNAETYQDRLEFGAAIAASDVSAARDGYDLLLKVGSAGDAVRIFGWYDGTIFNRIENIVFADGTVWRPADVDAMTGEEIPGLHLRGGGTLTGSPYDDELLAEAYGAILLGGDGDDYLGPAVFWADGGVFDLVFEGGRGNDSIRGSYAGDTYRFDRGDGQDTVRDDVSVMGSDVAGYFAATPNAQTYQDRLELGAGIRPEDITATRMDSDLLLQITGGADSILFRNWYDGTIFNRIESFVFTDGTTWFASEVDAMAGQESPGLRVQGGGTLTGSQYDDELLADAHGTTLVGGPGDDQLGAVWGDGGVFSLVFEGGRGNDLIRGSYAGDTYHFDRGDGQDIVWDDVGFLGTEVADFFAAAPFTASYQDRLEFGAGLRPDDITAARSGSDLVLRVAGGTDSVTIQGWYDGTMFNKIESFVFADGTTWLASEVDARLGQASPGMLLAGSGVLQGSQYADTLTATGYGTQLLGGAGNDTLQAAVDGGVFGLVFHGGTGTDTLYGSYAGDVYRFDRGDGRDSILDDVGAMGDGIANYFHAAPWTESYQDRLEFGAGIAPGDVTLSRVDSNLSLRIGTEDEVMVHGWYASILTKLESVVFADGTTWLASDIDRMLGQDSPGISAIGSGTVLGSQYADSLVANGHGARLEGGAGNDHLGTLTSGGIFDLSFVGGRGNDLLTGSYARDFYYYDAGDGHDVIRDDVGFLGQESESFFALNPHLETYQDSLVFGAGITAADVTAHRADFDDLQLRVFGGEGSITIQDWFDGTISSRIERISFQDGTTWTPLDIDRLSGQVSTARIDEFGGGHFVGTPFNDVMYANAHGTVIDGGLGDDHLGSNWWDASVWDITFKGGAGNDTLEGTTRRDTYLYNLGDGLDLIRDNVFLLASSTEAFVANPAHPDFQDRIVFGEGITPGMVTASRFPLEMEDPSLLLKVDGQAAISIEDFFRSDFSKIELVGFADGTTWTAAQLEQMAG